MSGKEAGGGLSDLWCHLMERLGRNASNYFKYDSWGLCAPLGVCMQSLISPHSYLRNKTDYLKYFDFQQYFQNNKRIFYTSLPIF